MTDNARLRGPTAPSASSCRVANSPPVCFFDTTRGKTPSSWKLLFSARIIPYRGVLARLRVRPEGSAFRAHQTVAAASLPVTIILARRYGN